MRLLVGLGNPGTRYQNTPHNIGFRVVDRLGEQAGIRVTRREAQALAGAGRLEEMDVVLAKPQTLMNASGLAVGALVERYGLGPESLIVIADDVALPWGMLRIRERGSAGGHNGLESVIGALGTTEFLRLRVGIRPEHPRSFGGDLAAYVLAPLRPGGARAEAEESVAQASEAVRLLLREGVKAAMTRFNRRVPCLP